MKISSVQAILLSYPFPDPIHLRYYGGERTILKRDAMLIRVETDKGIIGYAPGQATEAAKTAVDGPIAQFLNGRTLADPDALRVLFLKETPEDEYLCRMYASVEMALYDALGKVKGLPVSELIGGGYGTGSGFTEARACICRPSSMPRKPMRLRASAFARIR